MNISTAARVAPLLPLKPPPPPELCHANVMCHQTRLYLDGPATGLVLIKPDSKRNHRSRDFIRN